MTSQQVMREQSESYEALVFSPNAVSVSKYEQNSPSHSEVEGSSDRPGKEPQTLPTTQPPAGVLTACPEHPSTLRPDYFIQEQIKGEIVDDGMQIVADDEMMAIEQAMKAAEAAAEAALQHPAKGSEETVPDTGEMQQHTRRFPSSAIALASAEKMEHSSSFSGPKVEMSGISPVMTDLTNSDDESLLQMQPAHAAYTRVSYISPHMTDRTNSDDESLLQIQPAHAASVNLCQVDRRSQTRSPKRKRTEIEHNVSHKSEKTHLVHGSRSAPIHLPGESAAPYTRKLSAKDQKRSSKLEAREKSVGGVSEACPLRKPSSMRKRVRDAVTTPRTTQPLSSHTRVSPRTKKKETRSEELRKKLRDHPSFLETIERLRGAGGAGGGAADKLPVSLLNTRGTRVASNNMLVMSRDPADAAQKMQFASSSGTQQFNQLDQLDAFQGSLDEEQKEVLHACLAGANVFFSGMGGTGKTFLLKRIVAALKARHGARAVACCAPTGVRMYNRRGA
jgi:hypothetical protein